MQATIHGSLVENGEVLLGGPWTAESTDRGWIASAQLIRQTQVRGVPRAGRYMFRVAGDPTLYEVEFSLTEGAGPRDLRVEGRGARPIAIDDGTRVDCVGGSP